MIFLSGENARQSEIFWSCFCIVCCLLSLHWWTQQRPLSLGACTLSPLSLLSPPHLLFGADGPKGAPLLSDVLGWLSPRFFSGPVDVVVASQDLTTVRCAPKEVRCLHSSSPLNSDGYCRILMMGLLLLRKRPQLKPSRWVLYWLPLLQENDWALGFNFWIGVRMSCFGWLLLGQQCCLLTLCVWWATSLALR
jgi:hypothetical protein